MQSVTPEQTLAEPAMQELLNMLGINVEYTRAEGDTLRYVGPDGTPETVVDYAGGYGALVLGHNHPALVDTAVTFLSERRPVLAQASRQPAVDQIAARLNDIVGREFGTDERYFAIFSNSGAESIEVALKHAEFDRVLRVRSLLDEVEAHIAEVAAQAQTVAPPPGSGADLSTVLSGLRRDNAEAAARPPVFVALAGSFHGKLVGSVQLTHNPSYRTPFAGLAPAARFVSLDDLDAFDRIAEETRTVLRDVRVVDGVAVVVERPIPVVAAFVMEVIQGEGGIRVVTPAQADRIRQGCAALDCPIVVDEIQSGLGRTGAFFASSQIGFAADYLTLAKGLGGGITKTAVTLVAQRRYRRDFALVHSSTFARDGLSTAVTARVLELLEAENGAAYLRAKEKGEKLAEIFHDLRRRFPGVVREVRGRGLMLGLEFDDQSGSAAPAIAGASANGMLGYVISGYLLRVHRIRTFPTASAANTLRFEPSLNLADADIERLRVALEALCVALRDQDEQALMGGGAG
ncbi:aspartate aminotransferase family protein [Micromonospora sp. MMS20-R2-29]|uniref:Aspartate aminotransferase family protein n=1 Tax=Micromonospora humidisoli TaxID=2807622 RepID=A0ABS2JID9_9ACTN|nr:aspartate aminotransferase family protein [Micromonospora humidisoli]